MPPALPAHVLFVRLTVLLLAGLLAACTPRPGPEALRPATAASDSGARTVRLYVATTRATPEADGARPSFATGYLYYDVSVPPERDEIRLSTTAGTPDPARHYFVRDSGTLTRRAFLSEIRAHPDPETGALTGLFVHGFNTSHAEAVFRLAQLAATAETRGAPVLFSWPSRGQPLEYVADRQAATFSRDALTALLADLAPAPGRMLIFGHSMGGWLTMEALRSLRLAGRDDVIGELDVVLAAPDIDPYVFGQQLRVVGPMRQPPVLLVSPRDRVLALSSRLAGGRRRVGALDPANPTVAAAAEMANIEVIDISGVDADPLGHSSYVRLARLYSRLQAAGSGQGDLRSAGAYVLNTLDATLLKPVTSLAR